MRIGSWGRAKTIIAISGPVLIGFVVWVVSADWRYSKFPNSCPMARNLPENAVATKCSYEGLIDFTIDFQAAGSRSDMDHLIEEIQDGLLNPRLYDTALTSEDRIQITADHGVWVYFEWDQGVISMSYHDG